MSGQKLCRFTQWRVSRDYFQTLCWFLHFDHFFRLLIQVSFRSSSPPPSVTLFFYASHKALVGHYAHVNKLLTSIRPLKIAELLDFYSKESKSFCSRSRKPLITYCVTSFPPPPPSQSGGPCPPKTQQSVTPKDANGADPSLQFSFSHYLRDKYRYMKNVHYYPAD